MIYLTEDETAERLHLGRRTLQRWRISGEGPKFCRLGPRRIAYREVDVDAWVESRVFASVADEYSRTAA